LNAGPRVYGPPLDAAVIATTWLGMVKLRTWVREWWSLDLIPGDNILQHLVVAPHLYLAGLVVPVWLMSLWVNRTYDDLRQIPNQALLIRLIRATVMATLLLTWGIFALGMATASRTLLLAFPVASVATLFSTRMAMRAWLRRHHRDRVNILVIGHTHDAAPLLESLVRNESRWGQRVYGVVRPGLGPPGEDEAWESGAVTDVGDRRIPVLGRLAELPQVLETHPVHKVFLTGRTWETSSLRRIADCCEELGVEFSMDANFLGLRVAVAELQDFEGWSVLSFSSTPTNGEAIVAKRLLDIAGALVGLISLSPFFFITALALKLEDAGAPIFFGQTRSGLYGKTFTMWKFRSMVVNAEALKEKLAAQNEMSGPVFKMKRDPRITRVGALIRKLSIDEFPQFWNVLVGEMSLVGPRPPIPAEVVEYERWQMRRLSMRPGITCIWQVSGRNEIDFETWMKLDLQYIDNWSLAMDMKLLLKTIPVVLRGSGAS